MLPSAQLNCPRQLDPRDVEFRFLLCADFNESEKSAVYGFYNHPGFEELADSGGTQQEQTQTGVRFGVHQTSRF